MISKAYGVYNLACDICGEEDSSTFSEFDGAVKYKKMVGWKSQKRKGEWQDVCPECQEAGP